MANTNPKIRSKKDEWAQNEIDYLIANFATTDNKILSEKLSKPTTSIRSKATVLGLKKELWKWTDKSEKWLFENYKEFSNDDLVTEFRKQFDAKRTKWALIAKYRELRNAKK